jgi:hypothetical protein
LSAKRAGMKMLDYALMRGVWPHRISEIVTSFNLSPRDHGAEAPLDADALYRPFVLLRNRALLAGRLNCGIRV